MEEKNTYGFKIPEGYESTLKNSILLKVKDIQLPSNQKRHIPTPSRIKPLMSYTTKWLIAASVVMFITIGRLSYTYFYPHTVEFTITEEELIPILEMDEIMVSPIFSSYIKSVEEPFLEEDSLDHQFILLNI